jgi:hypothetical protein
MKTNLPPMARSTPPQTAAQDATAHYNPVGTNGGRMERRRDDAAEYPTRLAIRTPRNSHGP